MNNQPTTVRQDDPLEAEIRSIFSALKPGHVDYGTCVRILRVLATLADELKAIKTAPARTAGNLTITISPESARILQALANIGQSDDNTAANARNNAIR